MPSTTRCSSALISSGLRASSGRPRATRSNGVALFGDLPFMVSGDSADVWSRQDEFGQEGSVGVPPDAFSAIGTGLGLAAISVGRGEGARFRLAPAACHADGAALRRLSRRPRRRLLPNVRPPAWGRQGVFTPADEPSQIALGERVLSVFRSTGVEIVAEDLGTVPDFVRESLARAGIPGYKVFRWERHWHAPGQPFRDPPEYPAAAVATSGTHDTEPWRCGGRTLRQRSAARCSRLLRSERD